MLISKNARSGTYFRCAESCYWKGAINYLVQYGEVGGDPKCMPGRASSHLIRLQHGAVEFVIGYCMMLNEICTQYSDSGESATESSISRWRR